MLEGLVLEGLRLEGPGLEGLGLEGLRLTLTLKGERVAAEGERLQARQLAAEDPERRLEVLQLIPLQLKRLEVAQIGQRA